jgi:FkbM family methyltransferase
MIDSCILYVLRALRAFGNAMSLGGRWRLPRSVLRRAFRLLECEVEIKDFDGRLRVRLQLSEHMQRRIFWMGYYSTDIVALLKKTLRHDMVVVDVGANIGEITMVAAQSVGKEGAVIAFEPVNIIANQLAEHVRINELYQVIIRRDALGKQPSGRVPIYASCGQEKLDENQGLASLYGAGEGLEPIEYVNVTTLDESVASLALTRVDMIKIDIEGGEFACLQGAESVLRRFRPMLIVEVQAFSARQAGWEVSELFQFLEGFGYEFFKIGSRGHLIEMDIDSLDEFQNVFCKVREEIE